MSATAHMTTCRILSAAPSGKLGVEASHVLVTCTRDDSPAAPTPTNVRAVL